jgi:DNA polymerase-4
VQPYHEPKSCSSENTFEQNTADQDFLMHEITRLSEKVGYELRAEGKITGCITIKLRYANFETVSKQHIIPYTASDYNILTTAKQLFLQLWKNAEPIRLIGVRCSQLVDTSVQMNLFEDNIAEKKLYAAIDDIKNTFGKKTLQRAGSLQANAERRLRPNDPLWIGKNLK